MIMTSWLVIDCIRSAQLHKQWHFMLNYWSLTVFQHNKITMFGYCTTDQTYTDPHFLNIDPLTLVTFNYRKWRERSYYLSSRRSCVTFISRMRIGQMGIHNYKTIVVWCDRRTLTSNMNTKNFFLSHIDANLLLPIGETEKHGRNEIWKRNYTEINWTKRTNRTSRFLVFFFTFWLLSFFTDSHSCSFHFFGLSSLRSNYNNTSLSKMKIFNYIFWYMNHILPSFHLLK